MSPADSDPCIRFVFKEVRTPRPEDTSNLLAAPGQPAVPKGDQPEYRCHSTSGTSKALKIFRKSSPKGYRSSVSYGTENTSRDKDRASISKVWVMKQTQTKYRLLTVSAFIGTSRSTNADPHRARSGTMIPSILNSFPLAALFVSCLNTAASFEIRRRCPFSLMVTRDLDSRSKSSSKSKGFLGRPFGFPETPFLN